MKRRQQMRRLTILITIVIIAVSLGIGIYLVSLASQPTGLDKSINQPVSSFTLVALQKTSFQPYGPAPTAAMQGVVQKYSGTAFSSNGKPVVVFIGGEFCQYCAIERWALVMTLMRFGNFTSLNYMTAAVSEGDYATYTFVGSSYSSSYIAFRSYEAADRSDTPLQSVPANYSAVWSHFGSGFPFVDVGNNYVSPSSLLANPSILSGKNWTQIISGISTSDDTGLQIREAANLLTAVICKVTQGSPSSVCAASPISSIVASIAGPAQQGLTIGGVPSPVKMMGAISVPRHSKV
jgi:Domain of unknown function (DUF929)